MAWITKSGKTSEINYDRRGTFPRRGIEVKDYSDPWREAESINKREVRTDEEKKADRDRAMRHLFSRDD